MTKETVCLADAVAEGVKQSQTIFKASDGSPVDRSLTVSASSWTRCERAQRFSKDRVPHDAKHVETWGWAEAGNSFEDWVVGKLRSGLPPAVELVAAGDEQRTLIDPDARLSATPDGILQSRANGVVHIHGAALWPGADHGVGLEIKSRGPQARADLPKPEHVKQAELQCELWARVAGINVEAVLLLYASRDRYDEIDVFLVPRRQEVWTAAVSVANSVFGAAGPMSLTPEGRATGECRYCPWKSQCNTAELAVPDRKDPELAKDHARELQTALQAREVATVQANEAAKAKVAAEHKVREVLREAGTSRAEVGGASVTLSRVKGRTTLDQNALEAAGVDLKPFRKTGEPGLRLTVRGRV